MSAIQQIEVEASNRRKLFRIADPEFANMKVLIYGRNGPQESTCLDISALGLGVLVPQVNFDTAEIGTILEYELQFGPLSPVRGLAIVSNRAETDLQDERGSLLRLGLRFCDRNQESLNEADRITVNRRRSSRYRIPEPLQPLCVCNDPLWLGDCLTITILDLSPHGLSGEINARRSVLAEGLRTVFRVIFPHEGVHEVPTRIIYANPTDGPNRFRIGCEFVRRSEEFLEAFESYVQTHAFLVPQDHLEASQTEQIPLTASTPGHIGILTHTPELLEARELLTPEWVLSQPAPQTSVNTVVCKHPEHGLPHKGYFILEVHQDHASDQVGGLEEEPQLGRQAITVVCENFQSYPTQELRDVISFALYFAVVRSAQSVSVRLSTRQGHPDPRLLDKLKKIGIEPLQLSNHPNVLELCLDEVWQNQAPGRALLLDALSRMAHLPAVARSLQKNVQRIPRTAILIKSWLRRSLRH